jgi:hypothetical protein
VLFIAIIAFVWGLSTYLFNVFPYSILKEAQAGGSAVRDALIGKLPWYYVATGRSEVVGRSEPDRMQPGLTLITGLGVDSMHRIKVVDALGATIHEWKVDWFQIWPDAEHLPEDLVPQSRPGASVHGTVFLDDGSAVFNFEYLGMVRLGPCGDVLWRLPYQTHHSLTLTERGTFWASGRRTHEKALERLPGYEPPFFEPTAVELSADGDLLTEISVFDVLLENDLEGLLYMTDGLPVTGDVVHLNDVEEFPSTMAEGVFRHGDIMVSLNFVNSVVVFDPATHEVRFISTGQYAHQHDPDFVDGNAILVFDNNYVGDSPKVESSRIELLSAVTGESSLLFAGSTAEKFYTYAQGKHQLLANDNILITETRKGRAFEIDSSGRVVWEYYNIADDGILGIVEDSQRLEARFDKVFFELMAARCGTEVPE